MRLRRSLQCLLVAMALVASASAPFLACATIDGAKAPTAQAEDAMVDGGVPTGALCPRRDLPKNGQGCDLPEGTACEVGRCRGRFAVCTQGKWVFAVNPPLSEQCPQFAPREGEACPACWSRLNFCTYGCGDAGGTPLAATCDGEDASWQLSSTTCRDVDPATDAGGDP